MGSTHQSSVDLGFVFPLPEKKLLGAGWRERSRPEASPRRSTRFDWLQEMLRWQSVIPEESHNYLDIYWKSAAERVNSAAKVVQEQSSRRATRFTRRSAKFATPTTAAARRKSAAANIRGRRTCAAPTCSA